MSKRKAQLQENVEDENVTFGGYEVDESGYVKKKKQYLSKSSWIELNEICVKLGFQLQCTDQVFKLKIHNDVISTPQKIYKLTVKSLTEKDTKLWKEMESQGRLANLCHANYSCSKEHLKNGKLSDRLVHFISKS